MTLQTCQNVEGYCRKGLSGDPAGGPLALWEVGHAPQGQGTPCKVPRQPLSTVPFDVLTCLEGQTTFESYETRTVASVSKIASQRFKNHVDRTSVIREKPRKPKDTRPKGRNDDAWPSPEPPNWGARLWGSAIAETRRRRSSAIPWPSSPGAGDPLQGPPTARFDDTLRHFDVFGGSNDL